MRPLVLTLTLLWAWALPGGGLSRSVWAEAIRLAPIIKEGSPGAALDLDPILPARSGEVPILQGSGAIDHGLATQIALPVTEYPLPGAPSAFRGLGRSVEDTEVQAYGIPLNYAQGGGMDLSIFPQYLWSGFGYQAGPSLGVFDPRAVSGTLTLVPWTETALARGGEEGLVRATQGYSSLGQWQTSVGARSSDRLAVIAGVSAGEARGPSGALSGRWGSGSVSGRYHLLATHVETYPQGSLTFPTPQARQVTARVIPILQADIEISDEALLKTSAFYDLTYLRYEDPGNAGSDGRNHVQHLGTENALLYRDWRFGLSARNVQFTQLAGPVPHENIGSVLASRTMEFDGLIVEPTVQAVGVTDFGVLPAGSFGVRHDWGVESKQGLFSRYSFSHRYPTLIDRYFIDPSFRSNAALTPEEDHTLVIGYEYRTSAKGLRGSIQGYNQWRRDVLFPQFNGTTTIVNFGEARVSALMHDLTVPTSEWLSLSHALTLTDSEVGSSGLAFPYMPDAIYVVSADVHGPDVISHWSAGASWRMQSEANAGSAANRVDGYGYLDLRGRLNVRDLGILKSIELGTQIENVFDKPIQFVYGYPSRGRAFVFLFTGRI